MRPKSSCDWFSQSSRGASINQGSPLYLDANGFAGLATNDFTAFAVATDGAPPGGIIPYSTDGSVERSDWTMITGKKFLKQGQGYFLSGTGKLATTGIQQIGVAKSQTIYQSNSCNPSSQLLRLTHSKVNQNRVSGKVGDLGVDETSLTWWKKTHYGWRQLGRLVQSEVVEPVALVATPQNLWGKYHGLSAGSGGGDFTLNNSTGSVSLVAGANITLSALNSTLTIIGAVGGAGSAFTLNGTTNSVSLSAGNNISLAIGASSISISAIPQTSLTSNLPPRLSFTQNMLLQKAAPVSIGVIASTGITAASAANNPFGSSMSLQRIFVPAVMSLTEVDLAFGIAFPATNQGQGSMSQSFEIYSFGNSTSLASVMSASRTVSWASGTTTAGTISSLQQGWAGNNIQPFTFPASSLSAGEYAVGHLLSWAAQSHVVDNFGLRPMRIHRQQHRLSLM